MLKGAYTRHAYPWHAHEEISLGLVLSGAIDLRTSSRRGIATAGSFVLVNAQEAHSGTPAAQDGWTCRTIHLNPAIVGSVAEELKTYGRPSNVGFRGPTFEDPCAARGLLDVHILSESFGSALHRQSRLIALIARLLVQHAGEGLTLPRTSDEPTAVRRARDFLDQNLSDKVLLDDLAVIAGIPRFRLLRAFQKEIGMSPHAWQLQARVRTGHRMLRSHEALADIAAILGFADQAHFTRVYKSVMGMTPGQYRSSLGDCVSSRE